MKITSIHLQNFKRFSDLKIKVAEDGMPAPKLVLLIGANGSGKSGVFDAFEFVNRERKFHQEFHPDLKYYSKKEQSETRINLQLDSDVKLEFDFGKEKTINFGFSGNAESLKFYGRSAVRNLPRLTKKSIGNADDILLYDTDRPLFYIDNDLRFENDLDVYIKRVLDLGVEAFFQENEVKRKESENQFVTQLRDVTDSINRIFGQEVGVGLKFLKPVTPADGEPINLIFKKGESEISYDLLSSGEKEVINTIFNLYTRTKVFGDAIYFFDELDAHLHTSLQYNLLKEVVENWIPANAQIWVATHSLGFIQYAHSAEDAVVIDFDHFNFDDSIELKPQSEPAVFNIAVPESVLPMLFKDKKLVFCENTDAEFLNALMLENYLFLGDIDKNTIVLRAQKDKTQLYLIDRDFTTNEEITALKSKTSNLKIWDYYCIENYFYHPQNLKEIYPDFDTEAYETSIFNHKKRIFDSILRGLDNVRKSYVFFKEEKNLLKNSTESFTTIREALESDDFETFYPFLKMKDQGGLSGIKNLSKRDLSQTKFFKQKLKEILLK